MPSNDRDEVLKRAIDALSATGDAALTKAATEGMPEREAVVAWVERCKRLVLTQRDTSALRSEIPALVDRLQSLLSEVGLGGRDPEEIALAFVGHLPAIRALIAEDVEAAFEGDPAAKSFAEIVISYPSIRAIAVTPTPTSRELSAFPSASKRWMVSPAAPWAALTTPTTEVVGSVEPPMRRTGGRHSLPGPTASTRKTRIRPRSGA